MNTEDRERLTRIETTVQLLKAELCGNGQPGRCAMHGKRIARLEQWRSMLVGAWMLLMAAVTIYAAAKK